MHAVLSGASAGVLQLQLTLKSSPFLSTPKAYFHSPPQKPKKSFLSSLGTEVKILAALGVAVLSYYFYDEYKKVAGDKRPSGHERKGESNLLIERPPETKIARSVSYLKILLVKMIFY